MILAAMLAGGTAAVSCNKDEQGDKAGAAGKGKNKKPDTAGDGDGDSSGDGDGEKPVGDGDSGGSSGGGYTAVDSVDNPGKVKGTVTYKGTKKMGTLSIDKDTEICKHGGEPDESLVVSGSGQLKNAVVRIEGISKGKKWDHDKVTVDNKECMFHPRVQLVPTKGTVIAQNSDPVLHNTNLTLKMNGTGKTLANIALPKQGQQTEKKLKKQGGVISVTCDVHKWMQSFLYVSDSPYLAVTGDDGSFAIDQVPAGEYTAKVWHEALGEKEAKVKVDGGGEASVDFAFD